MRVVVTTMKDEGPFLLEWVAHYLTIGFDHFIINTNDCSDRTDRIATRLQEMGLATHIDNPGPWKKGPQAAAYDNAMAHPKLAEAEWILVADADEFLDIKVGDGTLDALFAAVPDANVISFNWLLFGHNRRVEFEDALVTGQFTRSADPYQQWPVMCRALKTLYRRDAGFDLLSTHRPKAPKTGWEQRVVWRDADGDEMGAAFGHWGWHGTNAGVGFGTRLGRMNHYAVRSIGSYLMKRLRGDVRTGAQHPKLEDTGVQYWSLHCWNSVANDSITRHAARLSAQLADLRADPELAALHTEAVAVHRDRTEALLQSHAGQQFTSTFRDYVGALDCDAVHFAVTCPDLALELPNGRGPLGYRNRLKQARQAGVKFVRMHHKLPWFANVDATGVDFNEGRLGTRSDDPSLAPLDAPALVGAATITHAVKPARRRARQAILAELGQRRKLWAVVGSGDPTLIRDIQRDIDPSMLYVLHAWGYRSGQICGPRTSRVPDPALVAQDLDILAFVDSFEARLKAGRMKIIRSEPYFALKTLKPGMFDGIFLAGAWPRSDADALIGQVLSRLAEGGLLVLDSYHRRGAHGDALHVALHRALGQEGGRLRIRALEGAYCAVERLAPL